MAPLLENKTAVIYGAGGAIGSAVAHAFTREGARVHVAGRTVSALAGLAQQIAAAGGLARVAQVDALDEAAIEGHLDQVVEEDGTIDVSFNAVGFNEVQGVPLVDLSLEDFVFPIANWSQTVFLTSRAAARRMIKQGSGVILTVKPPADGARLASGFALPAPPSIHLAHIGGGGRPTRCACAHPGAQRAARVRGASGFGCSICQGVGNDRGGRPRAARQWHAPRAAAHACRRGERRRLRGL
jgi:NAD(P)-dependent dehydrogenase (short-subunit alcohol dehydrogenase family)